jgi:heat-inducible transcriptional repressor
LTDRPNKAISSRVAQADRADVAIRSVVDMLVELTNNVGLATIGDQLYLSGFGRLFTQPEFLNGGPIHEVARLLDNLEPWLREATPNEPLNVYIGSENPIGKSSGCSLIISRFRSPFSDFSYIGVLGPTRQSYREVMGLVGHAGRALEASL